LEDLDLFFRLFASWLAMVILPFWLGSIHVNVGTLAAFCLLAGASLALAEDCEDFTGGFVGLDVLIEDIALRTVGVLVPAIASFAAAALLT
jgi:hypothetical protein